LQVFYYSTGLFISSGLSDESAKLATIGIGCIMVCMTLVSIPLMDRTGRRTLHLYGLGGMFIMSIFITISFLIKVRAFQAVASAGQFNTSELRDGNLIYKRAVCPETSFKIDNFYGPWGNLGSLSLVIYWISG
jgi:hypothetical protein